MGTNFNPTGLKTFAEMGFQPQFNINRTPQNIQTIQAPVVQTAPQAMPMQPQVQNPSPQVVPQIQNNQNINLEKTPKKDTITIAGKEFKKKNALLTGLGIAAAITVAGILAFRGKNKTPMPDDVKVASDTAKSLISRAKNTLSNATIFREEGRESVDKICALADEADTIADKINSTIETVTRRFHTDDPFDVAEGITTQILDEPDRKMRVLQEFMDENTTPFRVSLFNKDGIVENITETMANGKKSIISITEKGKVHSYEEGVAELSDRTVTDKILTFENGRVSRYKQNVVKFANGEEETAMVLDLLNGKPQTYMEGIKKTKGEVAVEHIKRAIDFKDGNIQEYREGIEIQDSSLLQIKKKFNYDESKYQENYTANYSERTETRERTIFLNGDKPKEYEEGVVCENDTLSSIQSTVSFIKGKPQTYMEGIKVTDKGARAVEKIINYTDGKPNSYMENCKIAQNGTTSARRELEIKDGEWIEITSDSATI